ncbi:hypothetical protein BJ944DRAFT_292060 [Cunninghamella echinulata]|nr:hypothetical protein BJ944DRAFT_292060 [Cunninghamella echinulata]
MLLSNRLWKKSIKEDDNNNKRVTRMMMNDDNPKNNHNHSYIKKKKSRDQVSLMESNFSNLTYISEIQWDDELERISQHGQDLSESWYHLLDKLAITLNKLTSPFENTNRASLHQIQKFIEYILNDRKTYGHEKIYLEKLQGAIEKYSESADLRDCAQQIYEIEKDLYNYRHTLDLQLTFLWNTKQKDQGIDLWKKYIHQYHASIKQMETKYIDQDYIQVPTNFTKTHHPSRRPSTAGSLLISSDNNSHISNTNLNNNNINQVNNNNNNGNKENYPQQQKQQRRKSSFQRLSFMPQFKNSLYDTALLKCECTQPQPQPQPSCRCPRCQNTFGPEDCTFAIGLDNLIRLYFPRQDHVYHKYEVRQKQLKRKSIFNSLSIKLIPSSSTPQPRQQQKRQQSSSAQLTSFSTPSALSTISSSKGIL